MTSVRKERLKYELRQEILSAARDLFVSEGVTAVSMRKIAERVGCAPGTLYLHFEDKDAILAAICIETFSKLDKRMESIRTDNSSHPLDRLRRGGRVYIQFGIDHPAHYFLTFALGAAAKSGHPEAKQAGLHSFDCLRACVSMAIEAGLLRNTDLEAVTQSIWAAMHGLVMMLITKPGFPPVEENRMIDTVLDMVIEGIRKP